MSFWNYIGEFLLFRWLFGTGKQDVATRNVEDISIGRSRNESHYNNSYSRFDNNKAYGNFRSDDYFHDEQDDYDMMDDFYYI